MNIFTDIIPLFFPLFQLFKRNTWSIKYKRIFRLSSYLSLILWAILAIYFEFLEKDIVNVTLLAFMAFLIAYFLRYDQRVLEKKFIVYTVSIAVLIYFPAKIFDGFFGAFTNVTAYFTYFLSKELVKNIEYGFCAIYSPIYTYKFTFACTGLQSIALIISPILAINYRKYWRKAIIVGVLIYILNVFRGVGIIYGVEVLGIDYYILHTLLMKFFSIIAIMIIFYLVLSTTGELVEELRVIINYVKNTFIIK